MRPRVLQRKHISLFPPLIPLPKRTEIHLLYKLLILLLRFLLIEDAIFRMPQIAASKAVPTGTAERTKEAIAAILTELGLLQSIALCAIDTVVAKFRRDGPRAVDAVL